MEDSLSLPSKVVASAHSGGLNRAYTLDRKLSAEKVVRIENISELARLRSLLAEGHLFPSMESMREVRKQSLSRLTGVAGMLQGVQEARKQSLSGLTGVAGMLQEVQEARKQSLSGLTGVAEMLQGEQEIRKQVFSGLTGQLQGIAEFNSQLATPQLAVPGTAVEIQRLLRLSALHHPELATVGPSRRQSSVGGSPSINLWPDWQEHLQYLVHSLPSLTWQWVRENPGTALGILLAILTWLIPPPNQWRSTDRSEEEFPSEHDRVIAINQVDLRSKPSSHSIITDTLHYNTIVEHIDTDGPWTKIKYRDRIDEETKRGWVLNHYLEKVE